MDALLQNPNVRKFLDLIGNAEGANYDTIVGGGTMSDFTAHPNKVGLVTAEGPSTAAGRYQIVNSTYQPYAKKLGINDFSPNSQDKIALALISDKGALPDILNGNYDKAVSKLGSTWASLPSSPYSQPKRSNDWVAKQVSNPMASNDEWGVKNTAPIGQAAPQADEWGVAATRAIAPTASDPAAPSAPEPARGHPTMQNDPRIVNPNGPRPTNATPRNMGMPDAALKAQGAGINIFKTADDLVRAAANGLTFGWADRAAAAGNAALGSGDYASNVKQERKLSKEAHDRNPTLYTGTELGSGLLLPGGVAIKGLEKAAPVVGNTIAGALYGGLSGSGAESGDTNLGQAVANTATGAAIGAPAGAVLTPVIGKVAEKLSGAVPWIDQKLTKGFIAKNFEGNANAKVDAEITRDIGLLKNGTDKTIKPLQMNDLEKRYVNEARTLAERSGMLQGDDIANLTADHYRTLLADPAKLQQLQSFPVGRALVDNLQKANRANELTQAIEANNGMIPKTARTLVDSGLLDAGIMASTGLPVPIASAARAGIKKALGGNETRTEVINQVGSPRALKAADQFIADNGASDATKSMGVLKQAADDRLALDMANGREAALAKRTAMAEATKAAEEKAAQQAAQQAEKQAIREGGQIIKQRQAAEKAAQEAAAPKAAAPSPISEANKLISEQMSKDPTFMLGLSNPHGVPRNEQQMSEFSKVLKDQMERRVTKEVEEKATSIMDKALGGDHSELSMGSPAFKTTAGALGMEPEVLKGELLTLVTENPKLKTAVGKLFTSGVSPTKKEFYGIQDAIAAKLGITPKNPNAGVLNVTPVSGALSDATTKKSDIANFVRGLPDDQVKAIVGREADTLGKSIASQKGYAVGKLSKIIDDVKAGKEVPAADMELIKSLGLM